MKVGEADELIKTIQTTDANFDFAWKPLEDHYRNVRWLVSIYISNLLYLPAVTSKSASKLKTLLSGTCNAFEPQKTITLREPLRRFTCYDDCAQIG